jgi:DNA-binding NarL/FixJ family response regulator
MAGICGLYGAFIQTVNEADTVTSPGDTIMRVLLVDDEPGYLEIAQIFLEKSSDMHIETALSASEALALSDLFSFDAIVSDYEMPGLNGIEFLKTVRKQDPHIPFLIFTGRGRDEVVLHPERRLPRGSVCRARSQNPAVGAASPDRGEPAA